MTTEMDQAISEAVARAEVWIAALNEELETVEWCRRLARIDREQYGYTSVVVPPYEAYLQLQADIREATRLSCEVYCEIIRNHLG